MNKATLLQDDCLREYWAGICRDRAGSGILPDGKRKD